MTCDINVRAMLAYLSDETLAAISAEAQNIRNERAIVTLLDSNPWDK